MKRKYAVELLPMLTAFAEGKPIQYNTGSAKDPHWEDVESPSWNSVPSMYRIKPVEEVVPTKAPLSDDVETFEKACMEYGALVLPSIAARILGTTPQNVSDLLRRGKFTQINCFDKPWIPIQEVIFRGMSPHDKGGRPFKPTA